MSQVSVSTFSSGWFRYTSPADMPRERVDEFFECAIDVSASEEKAFLNYLAGRGISLFVNLELRDIRMFYGDVDASGFGFRLSPDDVREVCEAFWAILDSVSTIVRLSRPGRCAGWVPLSSLIQKLARLGEYTAISTLRDLPLSLDSRVRWTLYGTSLTVEVA